MRMSNIAATPAQPSAVSAAGGEFMKGFSSLSNRVCSLESPSFMARTNVFE